MILNQFITYFSAEFMIQNIKAVFMRSIFITLILFFAYHVQASEAGDLFSTHCAACHTIGKGRLVGPDLKDINQKRDHVWLLNFIKSSQDMIKSGDAEAVKVFNEYNKLLMPNPAISESQIEDVLNYIGTVSSGEVTLSAQVLIDPLESITQINIDHGRALFIGTARLENNGAACLSCHHVMDDLNYPGGKLAKDLTKSYDLLGAAGILAIVKNSPFPAMAQAYAKYPLTESEVMDLSAYLKSVSQQRIYQHPRNFNLAFLYMGQFTFLVFLIVILALYRNRKKKSVNEGIYNRQSS